jgi:hypothetical protein
MTNSRRTSRGPAVEKHCPTSSISSISARSLWLLHHLPLMYTEIPVVVFSAVFVGSLQRVLLRVLREVSLILMSVFNGVFHYTVRCAIQRGPKSVTRAHYLESTELCRLKPVTGMNHLYASFIIQLLQYFGKFSK